MKDVAIVRSGGSVVGLGLEVGAFLFPTHLPLDIYYVRKFGEKEGYQKFKEDLLQQLSQNGIATVLVHPEGFVRTVQSHDLLKIPLTLLRKGMMKNVYDRFLCEFKGNIELKRYIDLYHLTKRTDGYNQ